MNQTTLQLVENNALSELETVPGPASPETNRVAEANSVAVEARLGALREIQPQVVSLCRPEDAAVLRGERSFPFLKHSMGIYRLTRAYLQGGKDDFWENRAFQYVKHLVLSNSSFSHIGIIYAIFRRERPDLPSLADIHEVQPLMRFVDGIANSAMRIFDDFGDREIDLGAPFPWINGPESSADWKRRTADELHLRESTERGLRLKQISLFNAPDPILARAFLDFIGITDQAFIKQAINGFQARNHEGGEIILKLWVGLLRKQVRALPHEIHQRYGLYVTLIKRLIECGYVNRIGDQAYSA